MTASDDLASYLIDRRRLRKKLTFWRACVVVFVLAGLGFAGWQMRDEKSSASPAQVSANNPHIARLNISGLITGDKDTITLIQNVTKSQAKAVILMIDSPGGTTTGSERLYKELRTLAAKKPVVTILGDMAASGAYIAALGSDHILASGNSLVGSIGVLFQYPNFSRLLDFIGVSVEEVKSSPLKAAPNGLEPTSPEARAALAALVSDSFNWFKSLVQERRNLTEAELNLVADGRVFTGRQALPLKLIDGIGEEKEALDWLHESKKIAADLPIRDWKVKKSTGRLGYFGFAADLARLLGYEGAAQSLEKIDLSSHQAALDGLLVIWQVRSANGS